MVSRFLLPLALVAALPAAALAHAARLQQNDLHPRCGTRLRRHGARHAAADNDHRVGDDPAKRRKIWAFLYGNGIEPGRNAIASVRHGGILACLRLATVPKVPRWPKVPEVRTILHVLALNPRTLDP